MDSRNSSQIAVLASAQTGLLVDDFTYNIFVLIFFVAVMGSASFIGIIFNAINIIVFRKQGFKDTVNITLFGLAISDIGGLMSLIWLSICFNPWFTNADLPFDTEEIQYVTAGWPHTCFTRITGWITAFVTFERCLCIAMPLKVKTIITPRRTTFVVVGIYSIVISGVVPAFYSIRLGPKFYQSKNVTKIGLLYIPNGVHIENVAVLVNIIPQYVSFLVVIVCTIILVRNLTLKSKWRKSTSNSAQQNSLSNRDKKVVSMIILISSIFMACFLPSAVNQIIMIVSVEYSIYGINRNLFLLSWSICKSLEAVNSAVNIFVYYNMSSRYREILDEMLNRNKGKK
ncbi:growth hormone secretagogue receptor type 1-like [Aplysia californica]|uniref:Growth hormone secretagogue receptor type 1-like n=1 Tax=Aplysia californica TaxID=6500 RepID=A0ABM0JG32_APLCA|nr:growth hormone secretagogue receptor type 1-like [Aplysia californica]